MNSTFFQEILSIVSQERLDAYRQDGADEATTLGRYLWNAALSESLYSPLQMAEVALRNAVHKALKKEFQAPDWFGKAKLTSWDEEQVKKAKQNIQKRGKTVTPDRIVAELNFGFWTSFFDNHYANTKLGPCILKRAFPNCPKHDKTLPFQRKRWKNIRTLRNRIFHHERILHWTDLPDQHRHLLEAIGWISSAMKEVALNLDRFGQVYSDGIAPWKDKIHQYWPP